MRPDISRRTLPICLLVFSLLPATEAQGQDLAVPIRWCVVEGAPAATSPAFVDEPDTDNVLWRRHERISEASFIPLTGITLRSGIWNLVEDPVLRYPVIPDQDTSNPNHQLGDVQEPFTDSKEAEATYNACAEAWRSDHGVENIGLLVVVARQIRTVDGGGLYVGTGSFNGHRLIVEDNAFLLPTSPLRRNNAILDGVDANLGHEIGHAMGGLFHVCPSAQGGDDANLMRQGGFDLVGADKVLDNFQLRSSVRDVDLNNAGAGVDGKECTSDDVTRTVDQIERLRTGARKTPGCKIVGTNLACSTVSDMSSAAIGDVALDAADIARLSVSAAEEEPYLELRMELLGTVEPELLRSADGFRYVFAMDIDDDPSTGGSPGLLGIPSAFGGAELVTEVRVAAAGTEEGFVSQASAWSFVEGRVFVLPERIFLGSGLHGRLVFVDSWDGSGAVRVTGSDVVVQLDKSFLPATLDRLRIQALVLEDMSPAPAVLDRLDHRPGEPGRSFRLRFPTFPTASVVPGAARPGETVELRARGLLPLRETKVFLGASMIATGSTDETGDLAVFLRLPKDSRPGRSLLTAGVKGTALEAVAVIEVLPSISDCNGNGVHDPEELAGGGGQDVNGNGIPDECEVRKVLWTLRGTAAGGTLTVALEGFSDTCTVTIVTTAGSTAEMVAVDLATALEADTCTTSQGFSTTATAGSIEVRGFLLGHVSTVLEDPGLGITIPVVAIPSLTPGGGVALVLLLMLAAWVAIRRSREVDS